MIHMNNVTKVYPNGSTGVENINLHINKGEFVFIVGSSGSGKSTLMKLLLKELDPTEGDIIINKVKTNELNRRSLICGVIWGLYFRTSVCFPIKRYMKMWRLRCV